MGTKSPHTAWLDGRRYHIARVALLALACVLVAAGLLMLAFSSGQLSRTQQVAADLVSSQARAEVLVIASHDDGDAATRQQRDGLVDLLNRSQVAVDVEYLDVDAGAISRNVPGAVEGSVVAPAAAEGSQTGKGATDGTQGATGDQSASDSSDAGAGDGASAGAGDGAGATTAGAGDTGAAGEGSTGTVTTTTTTTLARKAEAATGTASDNGDAAATAGTVAADQAATGQFATGDTAAYGAALAQSAWAQALQQKIAAHGPYSAIICIDDEALCYVEAMHESLFPQTPVVFFGVNDAAHAQRMFELGYATGLVEALDISGMLDTAAAMQERATNVLVLTDDTATGIGERAQLQQAIATASDASSAAALPVTYLNSSTLSRADLAQRVSEAGEDTIVLYLGANTDSAGSAYRASQSTYFVSSASSRPVFAACFSGVGEGFAGSTFVDYANEGQRAGDLVVMILNGTRPADIPLETFASEGTVFDAAVLSDHGIATSALPASAATLHTSGLSIDSLRPILMPVMLLILGFACLVAFAVMGYRRTASDMSDIVTQRNLLEQRFYTDALTEMPNMQWLTAYAGSEASTKIRAIVEVLVLGLDQVDALRGQGTADEVVKVLASRLNGLEKAFLVRPGTNEFILGVEHELDAASPVLKKMERALRRPIPLAGDSITVDPCIGVYNREPGLSIEEMVAGVDIAIRQSEQLGMSSEIIFYDSDMRTAVEHKLDITTQIRRAIEKDGFIVVYQPQVDLASNEVVGYEALLRMRGDHYPPEQFIPVAEMNGQIVDIDRIVTKKVVGQLATWKKRKQRMRPVSINYGYGQLRDDDYIDYLVGLLDEQGLSHSLIRMDIREGLFLNDMAKASGFVEDLADAGFGIAIDGFGAGLESLSHMTDIPVDVVKLDRTVTATFFAGGDAAVIANLVRMAHRARKLVVIEGVETLEQLQKCRVMGCDVVQGFFFSEPMLPEQAVRYKPAPLPPVPADLLAAAAATRTATSESDQPANTDATPTPEPASKPEPEAGPTSESAADQASQPDASPTEPTAKAKISSVADATPDAHEAEDLAATTELASASGDDSPRATAADPVDQPRASSADGEVATHTTSLDADGDAPDSTMLAPASTTASTNTATTPTKGAGLEALFVSTAEPAAKTTAEPAKTEADSTAKTAAEPTAESLDSPSDQAPADSASDLATNWATTPEEVVASFTAGPDGTLDIDIAFAAATTATPDSDAAKSDPATADPTTTGDEADPVVNDDPAK